MATSAASRPSRRSFLVASAWLGALALAALFALHPEVPLLLFAGVLAAILLDGLAEPLRRAGLSHRSAIALVAGLGVAGVARGAALGGSALLQQGRDLFDALPGALDRALAAVEQRAPGGEALVAAARPSEGGWQRIAPLAFGSVAGVFSTLLGVASGLLAVSALALFFALGPGAYVDGVLHLFPGPRRPRLREVAGLVAHALRRWLVGRAIAMAIVALVTGIGLLLLGVPYAFALALVAGILTFVPYVGPILAAAPALVVAGAEGMETVLSVGALYVGAQLLEDYVVTPVVQGRALSLPPALLVVAQVSLGVLLGGLGLLLATPFAVMLVVLVQTLYVEDVLGEKVHVLGTPR